MIRVFTLDGSTFRHTSFVIKHRTHKTGHILSDQRSGAVAVLEAKYILKQVIPLKKTSDQGYYCMENMTDSSYCEFKSRLKQTGRTTEEVADVIHTIASDIQKLMRKKLVYTDFNKRNIFISSEREIAWIDTDS